MAVLQCESCQEQLQGVRYINVFFIEDYVESTSAYEVSSYQSVEQAQIAEERYVPAHGVHLCLDFVALMLSSQALPFVGCGEPW